MKRLTTLASTIALIAAPSMALASGYQWTNDTETIHGDGMDSKQAAYEMGRDMIQSYQNKSSGQLRDEFTSLTTYVDRQSFSITDSKVMVNEFLQSDGQVVYQPILNVQYEYRMRDTGKY
ncbi:hypothetical protein K08M3_46890 [Vibrio alginolyticus]|uniref:DUF3316 domain-containing protein n=1 Tax=Vibrio alginolyticus TaxID=663 RepID=A0A1W6TKE0_VIBAL|nr:DUF3316 domain-containing protein [Vibrio alginolyticus]ARP01501.1 hypothetical protein K01M1_46770 [Vibrio alginolyticus]ARP06207.1 hypothetical protein K04M1_46760 [Vibrio alginolyticus]ARP11312.1 hypothetical protein K04M3_47350 [Vibrio alginolyticus]ARP16370.1 hypothetical protein K04M5_47100 [Vibrio alginolyticus]ARP21412.1 hypothetical protein K05K4_46950 [Vibrio alginolyticus]